GLELRDTLADVMPASPNASSTRRQLKHHGVFAYFVGKNYLMPRDTLLRAADLTSTKTSHQVVIRESHRLHEGVADRRAHEVEPALLEVEAQRVRQRRPRRHVTLTPPLPDDGRTAHQSPDIRIEAAKLILHRQQGPRISHGALDLEPVAHQPRILEQSPLF